MKNQCDKQEIVRLIDKFMAGTTSIAEEDVLAQYFRTNEVSGEWTVYKEMFALFDYGAVDIEVETAEQEGAAHGVKVEMPVSTGRKRPVQVYLRWTAAIVASLLLLLLLHNTKADTDCNTEAKDRMVMVQQQRMLDEADRSFVYTTIRCAMDINETFSQSEALEETDNPTNIYI